MYIHMHDVAEAIHPYLVHRSVAFSHLLLGCFPTLPSYPRLFPNSSNFSQAVSQLFPRTQCTYQSKQSLGLFTLRGLVNKKIINQLFIHCIVRAHVVNPILCPD